MKRNLRMTKGFLKISIALLVTAAATLTAAPYAGADEAGSKHLEEARITVQRSSLSKEAKTGILAKADRATAAGIPAEDVSVIIARGLSNGVESRHIEGLLEIATRTKEQNLPVRLILDRTEQGLAKGVPADKISGVTQGLSEHLAAARPIVNKFESGGAKSTGAKGSEDAVETVARALEKSIPRDAVMKTGESVKERKGSIGLFNRAVDTMTTFVGNGMTTDQAAKMVHAAVSKGYSEKDLEAMERYMVNERRKNRPMDEVVSGMNSRMERGEMMHDMQMQDRTGGGSMGGPNSGGMGGMGGMGGRR
jgi:hypothetical protein